MKLEKPTKTHIDQFTHSKRIKVNLSGGISSERNSQRDLSPSAAILPHAIIKNENTVNINVGSLSPKMGQLAPPISPSQL